MLGVVSSATTQHLFRCIFSTPEAILVVVNQKDAADSIGFVQSIHLEMPQMVLWHGQRPPKTTHGVILFWFFQKACDREAFPLFHVIMYCIAFHQAEMRSANTFN